MADKLKPCPFCGGKAHIFSKKKKRAIGFHPANSVDGIYWVACGAACEQSVEAGMCSPQEAIELWNHRVNV